MRKTRDYITELDEEDSSCSSPSEESPVVPLGPPEFPALVLFSQDD